MNPGLMAMGVPDVGCLASAIAGEAWLGICKDVG